MLSVQSASLSSGKILRVNNMSLTCEPSSITALLGPNGAGKTSLLKLLSGELTADYGELLLNDRQIHDWKPKERAKMLACLPQQSTLNFPFTVQEVVLMGRIPYDTGAIYDREIVRQVLDAVDSWHLVERNYTELSGGEKQRIQLARVLAQVWQSSEVDGQTRSRVLLLDEPSSSLDIAHQQLLQNIVLDMAQQDVVVIIVVHDLNFAFSCANQLVLMSDGQMVAQGTPKQMMANNVLQDVFGVKLEFIAHPTTGKPVVMLN